MTGKGKGTTRFQNASLILNFTHKPRDAYAPMSKVWVLGSNSENAKRVQVIDNLAGAVVWEKQVVT